MEVDLIILSQKIKEVGLEGSTPGLVTDSLVATAL